MVGVLASGGPPEQELMPSFDRVSGTPPAGRALRPRVPEICLGTGHACLWRYERARITKSKRKPDPVSAAR